MTVERPEQHTVLHLKYNFGYITVILLVALLAVITYKWTPQPRFTEYLSNAATLASLLLALVAIVYSFISSEGVSRNLGLITSVASEVRGSRDEVSKFIETAKDINGKTEQGAQLFLLASNHVKNELGSLSRTLHSIDKETRALEEVVKDIPNRLNSIEGRFDGIEQSLSEKHKPYDEHNIEALQEIDSSLITAFLERSSLRQNLLAIAVVLACHGKKVLSLEKFCNAIRESSIEGNIGFLTCMNAIGLASVSQVENSRTLYTINSVNSALAEQAASYFQGYLEWAKANTDDDDDVELCQDLGRRLAAVEALFGSSEA